ncbi:MAG: hypothetical protein EA384_11230 [Spirochaetaceae bacterium]|nr:MAG: hypothetical protein EA384_11230 [Spirochaetaceae bacterium]
MPGAAVVAGLLILLGACTTVQSREELAPDERWSYTVRELPGRDGRLRGELSFRGRRTPLYFSEVVVGSRRFTAALRTTAEGFEGYREDRTFEPPEPGVSGSSVSTGERSRGWYIAGLDQRRPATPAEWVWVRRENLEAWVNPLRIQAFAAHFKLAEMHEAREPRVQFMFSYGHRAR